jgi:hypothetical protein
VAPAGIVKFSTAADDDPALTTDADEPGAPVVTVPTAIVAAAPAAPFAPLGPKPPDTVAATVGLEDDAATSIVVSPTVAVIGLLVTLALIGTTAPRRSR